MRTRRSVTLGLGTFALALFATSLVSIAAPSDKDSHEALHIGPASSFAVKQTSEGITIGADVYETGAKINDAFGKLNPYDWGVLPILVAIDNHTGKPIKVDRLKVQYHHGEENIDATPASDLQYLHGVRRPTGGSPIPHPGGGIPGIGGKPKKNPLSEWQIEGRAFSAQVIPPDDTASGFFYFQTGHRSHSTLYITGLREVGSGREFLYFEIPLPAVQ